MGLKSIAGRTAAATAVEVLGDDEAKAAAAKQRAEVALHMFAVLFINLSGVNAGASFGFWRRLTSNDGSDSRTASHQGTDLTFLA